jgi:hypothetical protein
VSVAHHKSHSLTPLKPVDEENDVVAPAAVVTADRHTHAPANMFGAITPSPHAALPSMKSPPKYNNQVVAFSTIECSYADFLLKVYIEKKEKREKRKVPNPSLIYIKYRLPRKILSSIETRWEVFVHSERDVCSLL